MAGGTGQGKSVAITGMLDSVRARGDRAIIADDGGSFLARYGYHPERGDIILNPLDARSVAWSPLAEMRHPHDADAVAHSLIPDTEGEAAQWNHFAQTFASAILWRVFEAEGDNGSLLFHLLEADMNVLRGMLSGTSAAGLVGKGNERMFGSVRGTIAAYVRGLRYCPADAGREAFSLRKWTADGAGWAYFNYLDDQLRVLAPLVGTMLGMVATGLLSQTPDENRRTWLVLDEVAALGKIGALEDFLTKARKCGGCAIVGLQAIAQLRQRYGRNGAESMLSCLSSQLILNVSDPDTAEFLSRSLGDVQVSRQTRSGSRADHGAHANWSQSVQTERLILASEIGSTPKRCGFLKLAGGLPISPVRLDVPPDTGEQAERFVLRDTVSLPPPTADHGADGAKRGSSDLPNFGGDENWQP
jgi:type IV secretory pathway TraG/TraD family ATPase VirD4